MINQILKDIDNEECYYVGTNGCLYQDLGKEELLAIKQEIERLNNIIDESAEEILKELEENHHVSYGVALAIRQKLLDYKELKGSDKEWVKI